MHSTAIIDQKGRLILPKKLRNRLKIKKVNSLLIESSNSDSIVFRIAKSGTKNNKLFWDLRHPIKVDKRKLYSVNLER